MDRDKYLKALLVISKIDEDLWYRDDDGFYHFYKPEKMSPEAIEAMEVLNENESLLEEECEIREFYITF